MSLVNADKPQLWKSDIAASVDQFNNWFMDFAPTTYRAERVRATAGVEEDLLRANDLANLTPALLQAHPDVITTLRMSTAPPQHLTIARCRNDRVIPPSWGLSLSSQLVIRYDSLRTLVRDRARGTSDCWHWRAGRCCALTGWRGGKRA